jgi:hypothetical protein
MVTKLRDDGGPAELSPQEIRRIRHKLGLSQVEAGELLGGGPRACHRTTVSFKDPMENREVAYA